MVKTDKVKTVNGIYGDIMQRLSEMDDSKNKIEKFLSNIKDSRLKLLDDLIREDDKLRIRTDLASLRGMLEFATPEEFKEIIAIAAALI